MSSLAASIKAKIAAQVFEKIGETASFGSHAVKGKFFKKYREVQITEGGMVVGLAISFDTVYNDAVASLQQGDEVTIEGDSDTYQFMRCVPPKGQEHGIVTLELIRA